MKLLSPTDAREKARKSVEAEKYRLVEVQSLITQKYQELGAVEATFDDTLQKQRNVWAAELQEQENRKITLERICEVLEERRLKALLPLINKQAEWETIVRALDKRDKTLASAESRTQALTEQLTRRLDEVSERELNVSDKEKSLDRREAGVKAQEENGRINSERLTLSFESEYKRIEKAQQALAKQQAEAKAKEHQLDDIEKDLIDREIDVKTKEVLYRNYPFTSPIHGN